ncbi:MAG: secretin N-terminal domain-containing protein [Porticoccaceae bacterium]|nr:secretin N-terminal domain-containing protein [Porticoccaceae bacterium]
MIKIRAIGRIVILSSILLLACASPPTKISEQHINNNSETDAAAREIPAPVLSPTLQYIGSQAGEEEVYSVVVNDVDLRGLLFALSRDAAVDIDVASDIEGRVTLNAVDQTLFQILDRIIVLTDIRYSVINNVLVIEKDRPYFVHYDVDYLNMDRSSHSLVSISTEVATTGVGAVEGGSSAGGSGNNNSSTVIENVSGNHFWQTLVQNIQAIVYGGDSTQSVLPGDGGGDEGDESAGLEQAKNVENSIIVNAESGTLTIKATQKKHQEIQIFLDEVVDGAKRQVLIEASIIEVELNDDFQAGVDWSRVIQSGASGLNFSQSLLGANLTSAPVSTVTYRGSGKHDINATLNMLSEFGNAKVLSTPKLMVLNNQTALLKVVDNLIYFTIDVEEDVQDNFVNRTFTSDIHSVPVGLVMSVTPQISAVDTVTLSVRPTISRVLRFVTDPNPALATSNTVSLIPEISVREMESVMQIDSGNTAIIGGLMQDQHEADTSGVPGLSQLPYIGDLFTYRNNSYSKSELIVFIRPTVIKYASLASKELGSYQKYLPENIAGHDSATTE